MLRERIDLIETKEVRPATHTASLSEMKDMLLPLPCSYPLPLPLPLPLSRPRHLPLVRPLPLPLALPLPLPLALADPDQRDEGDAPTPITPTLIPYP